MSSQVPNRRLPLQNAESKNLALSKDDTGTILLLSLVSFIFSFLFYFIACLWYSIVYTGSHKCGYTCMYTCTHECRGLKLTLSVFYQRSSCY